MYDLLSSIAKKYPIRKMLELPQLYLLIDLQKDFSLPLHTQWKMFQEGAFTPIALHCYLGFFILGIPT